MTTAAKTSEPPKEGSDTCVEAATEKESPKSIWLRKNRNLWFPVVLVVPYLIAVAWHVGLHPTASVFTGDLSEARRWYIDENSLDPINFRMNKRYNLVRGGINGGGGGGKGDGSVDVVDSICDALHEVGVKYDGIVTCQDNVRESLQVVSIVPSNTAIAPTQEAVVVVVPFSHHWLQSQLHYSVLQLIKRLSSTDMSSAPWMGSKTVVFVSPRNSTVSLHESVQTFLHLSSSRMYMIRNLLVLDITSSSSVDSTTTTSTGSTMELRVLPQGRNGVLPNMDLVFLIYKVYSQIATRQLQLTIHTHSYDQQRLQSTWWWQSWFQTISSKWQTRVLDLLLFEYTLAMGSTTSPHAPALDLGIDALTLQLVQASSTTMGTTANHNAVIADVVSKLEPVLRALCNLHERLHHSTRLYLLVSPDRFVKHEEYLVPNLLLLIPLIVRAVSLILVDIQRIDLFAIAKAVNLVAGGVLVGMTFGFYALSWLESQSSAAFVTTSLARHLVVFATSYVPLCWYLIVERLRPAPTSEPKERKASIQFVTCLAAIYLHLGVTFGHVSLAFPSALLWTPLIAFPSFCTNTKSQSRFLGTLSFLARLTVVVITSPFLLLVLPGVFPTYTPYVQFLYIPLHLFVAMMWL